MYAPVAFVCVVWLGSYSSSRLENNGAQSQGKLATYRSKRQLRSYRGFSTSANVPSGYPTLFIPLSLTVAPNGCALCQLSFSPKSNNPKIRCVFYDLDPILPTTVALIPIPVAFLFSHISIINRCPLELAAFVPVGQLGH